LDRSGGTPDHDQFTAGRQGRRQSGPIAFTTGSLLREIALAPPICCSARRGIVGGSIDVDVRAQIFRKLFLITSAPELRQCGTPCAVQTGPQVPKAANALHGDQISTAATRIAKSVVGGNPRAEKRSGFR